MMAPTENELRLLGAERARFKAAGVVWLLILGTALTGFGVVLLAVTASTGTAKGWLFGSAFVAVGLLCFWAAQRRRASYVALCDNGFAMMKSEGVPRDIVRWDDVTDVKHHVQRTVTNGVTTDSTYTCSVHLATRSNPVKLTNKDFRDARSLGDSIQREYSRRTQN
jgi:hypothetical protein